MRKLLIILFLIIGFQIAVFSQTKVIDSLLNQLTTNQKQDSIRVGLLNELAIHYSNINLEKSEDYAFEALKLSDLLKYERGKAFSFLNLGLIYRKKSDFDSSLIYLNEALKIFENLKDKNGQLKSLHQTSIIYNSKGENLVAIECLYKCLEISSFVNNSGLMSDIYNSLSTNYNRVNNLKKAIEYVKKSHEIDLLLKDSLKISRSLNNLGYYYLKSDSLDKAKDYYNKSFYLSNKFNNKSIIGYNYYGLAEIYDKFGIFDTALIYHNEAIHSFNEYGNKQMEGQSYSSLGNHYFLRKDFDSALYHAKMGLNISKEYDDLENIKNIYDLLQKIYAIKKEYNNAYKYFNLFKTMEDSLQKFESIQSLTINELEYEFKLKQQIIDFEQQTALSKQKNMKNYFIAAFFVAFVIVILISYALYQKVKSNLILKKANETRDKMFKIISHDFRSPLISISNTLQLIPELIKEKDYNSAINLSINDEQSVSRVLSLIDNLINWTLSQNDDIPYKPEKYNLYQISQFIFDLYTPVANYKNIELKNNIPSNIEIYADKNILNTVLRNLINNAIKFTSDNDNVTVIAEQDKTLIKISVIDTGIGIPKEQLDNIFDLNHKKSLGTKGEKGNGLGLFFCKEFAIKNKGDIWVESQLGKGSKFYFTVPKSVNSRIL